MPQTDLLSLATDIAVAGGELAARRRAEGVDIAGTKSSQEDVVTLADREVESLIRSMIADARPSDGIVGEENEDVQGSSGLTWIVDPIDGTVNYLYGNPYYAVSVAVVEGDPSPATWTALAGAVVSPAGGDLFTAGVGAGARLGSRELRVRETVLPLALVATGFAYLAEHRVAQARVIMGLIGVVRDIRRTGTASLDLCSVACGRVDAYFETSLKPWDHAAGSLIASEAGAHVGGFRGTAAGEELVLAAAPGLAVDLERILLELHP